jgi:tetratricopeptide (TPR) repeat protein/cell division septation protein DedD
MKAVRTVGIAVPVWVLACAVFPAFAWCQATPTTDSSAFSNEPYIVDRISAKFVFEKDGTSSQETEVRVRVQSPAGVQQFGVLRLTYASAVSKLDVLFVRVQKNDGRVITTPPENILEMPSEITRQAPFYSDLKEKQVAVKGLEVGDTLDYQYREDVHTPLVPGQFWLAYNFQKEGIVLGEELQVSVPRGAEVKVRSPELAPAIAERGAYRVYSWKSANLEKKTPKQFPKQNAKEGEFAAVQLTTFKNWEEVGQWAGNLFASRTAPTPEIRAKAEELTRGATTDAEKIQSIYSYVSQRFRYIGIALGIGRYQPHTAAEVMANGFGDCKDKHTLLAALLGAAGLRVDTALVNTGAKIDPEVPSPGQFDHVVSVISGAQGAQWLDSTVEVAPPGYLWPGVRGKQALLIPASGAAHLTEAPSNLPYLSTLDFEMDGALNEEGTFSGKAQLTLRGDLEVLLRLAYRQTAPSQWQNVTQTLSSSLSFGGEVSDVSVDPPESTQTAFHIRYQYTRKDYGDWANRRIIPALPPVFLPDAPDEPDKVPESVELGALIEHTMQCTIKLPQGSRPRPPAGLRLEEDFADYRSNYSFADGTYRAERTFRNKASTISKAQFAAYRKFRKAVLDDETTFMALNGEESEPVAAGDTSKALKPPASAEALALVQEGVQELQRSNFSPAAGLFRKAVELDPQFGSAWVLLGISHMAGGSVREGLAEMKKGIVLDPSSADRCKIAARQLVIMGMRNEALELWRAIESATFDDKDAPVSIGAILMSQHRYEEALPELESGAARNPTSSRAQLLLGEAYLHADDIERAAPRFETAAKLDPSPETWNNIAYSLADKNVRVEDALVYARKAVSAVERQSSAISLETLEPGDLQTMRSLGAYWDTLGWVYFRLGRLDAAESYLEAAWSLTQNALISDHLGQLYEKQGNKQHAITAYARAVGAGHAPDSSRERLNALEGNHSLAARAEQMARDELSRLRSVKLPALSRDSVSAEFFVLIGPDGKAQGVRFISGAESLHAAEDALKSASYKVSSPEGAAIKFLRRGVLACSREPMGCTFVLIPPDVVVTLR